MRTLYVAAGGGGDAVGVLLARRLLDPEARDAPLVTTCAWERLRVDPVPGPRTRGEFVGLGDVDGIPAEVHGNSDTRPPGRSMLPRLAAETDARIFLHDFESGAVGLAEQLQHLAEALAAESLTVVDVGGDVVARGSEPSLLSPLADSLTVAASIRTGIPTRLAVLGPGVDGELSEAEVRTELSALGATRAGVVTPDDVRLLKDVLRWHPTEATTLVAASALGLRGSVDMRRGMEPVSLTERCADLWLIDPLVPSALPLATAVVETSTLGQAEAIMRKQAVNELDYERHRARTIARRRTSASVSVEQFAADRRAAGATHVTTRRLREATFGDFDRYPSAQVLGLGLWALDTLAAT